MVLDVVEEGSGRFLVWATDARGASALLCVTDFEPYFYIAGPRDQVAPRRPNLGVLYFAYPYPLPHEWPTAPCSGPLCCPVGIRSHFGLNISLTSFGQALSLSMTLSSLQTC